MIEKEEFEDLLEEVALEIPEEYYKNLNGGVVVDENVHYHEKSTGEDLVVLGEYHYSYSCGRQVVIYYGSFEKLYGWMNKEQLKEQMRETLTHELLHHWEHQAGEHQLEDQDHRQIAEYLENKGKRH